MEVVNTNKPNVTSTLSSNSNNTVENKYLYEIKSNWLTIECGKKLENVISCELEINFPSRMTLDDIVDEERCIEIKPNVNNNDECLIEIKMINNQKIRRIGVVSEASVLEIFRDSGEYATTIFPEFIDEFEDASVYCGEIIFNRPTTEASLKFMRIKNNNRTTMFLYGIRILVEEVTVKNTSEESIDFNLINDILKMTMGTRKKKQSNDNNHESDINEIAGERFENSHVNHKDTIIHNNNVKENEIKLCIKDEYVLENNSNSNIDTFKVSINNELEQMEQRLMNRINLFEENTNKKLNDIMKILETIKSNGS